MNGVFLVLGEGAAIVALLFEAFFVDETLVDVFDAVLIHKGFRDLVAGSRILNPNGENPLKSWANPPYPPFIHLSLCVRSWSLYSFSL